MILQKNTKKQKGQNDYLFTSRTGEKISIRAVENLVKKWGEKTDERLIMKKINSNLKDKLTPHTLRHSFTIYLLNKAKRPLNEVQQLLEHSNISTTQIYTRIDNEEIKKGYEKINWRIEE